MQGRGVDLEISTNAVDRNGPKRLQKPIGLDGTCPKITTFPKKKHGGHADLMFPPPLLVRLPPQLPRVAGCRPHCRAVPLRARRSCQPGPPEDPGEIEESAPTPGGTWQRFATCGCLL